MITHHIKIPEKNHFDLEDSNIEDILNGKIFIFPTDTVYGIGSIYDNENSIKNIYKTKGRDFKKPLVLYLNSVDEIYKYVSKIDDNMNGFLKQFLPGALTVILKKNPKLPKYINSKLDFIGIRVVDNSFLMSLIEKLGKPIVGTSANLSGQESIKDGSKLMQEFQSKIDYIFDMGICKNQTESTIIKIHKNEIELIRKGAIPFEQIKSEFQNYSKQIKY